MPKCLIFDCDGTLVDSELLANKALAVQLKPLGIDANPTDLVRKYRGWKLANIFEDILHRFQIDLPDDFVGAYRQKFSDLSKHELEPIDGVFEVLSQITLPMCVASSGPMHKIEESLRLTKLASFFGNNLFSSYDIDSWKPEPNLFLHAAKCMQVTPNDCWVVEDSEVGVEAAIAAGMRPIHFCSDQSRATSPGVIRISHMSQLLELLG